MIISNARLLAVRPCVQYFLGSCAPFFSRQRRCVGTSNPSCRPLDTNPEELVATPCPNCGNNRKVHPSDFR